MKGGWKCLTELKLVPPSMYLVRTPPPTRDVQSPVLPNDVVVAVVVVVVAVPGGDKEWTTL